MPPAALPGAASAGGSTGAPAAGRAARAAYAARRAGGCGLSASRVLVAAALSGYQCWLVQWDMSTKMDRYWQKR